MKSRVSKLVCSMVLTLSLSCDKDDGARCIKCDVEAVEICTDGNGMVSLVIEGETQETGQLREDQSFEEAAEQVCSSIEVVDGECAECNGPNVQAFELCSTEEGITIDGQLLEDTQGTSLDIAISILEDNPNGNVEFEDLNCTKN